MNIKVKPLTSINIELKDKTYKCTFNMLSLAYMQEELGKLDMKMNEVSPAHMASLILYSGIKPNHEDFTMDEAVALAMVMGPASYGQIVEEYNKAVFDSMDEKEAKNTKKMMAQIIAKQMK